MEIQDQKSQTGSFNKHQFKNYIDKCAFNEQVVSDITTEEIETKLDEINNRITWVIDNTGDYLNFGEFSEDVFMQKSVYKAFVAIGKSINQINDLVDLPAAGFTKLWMQKSIDWGNAPFDVNTAFLNHPEWMLSDIKILRKMKEKDIFTDITENVHSLMRKQEPAIESVPLKF